MAWALVASMFAISVIWSVSQALAASETSHSGEHLVSIYDRGEEHTVLTKAGTVKQALDAADIDVDPADVIEPALDEELIAKTYHVNVYRARPVVVADGIARKRVMTAEQSPRQIAKAAALTLYDEDNTKIERVDDVVSEGGAGLKLVIDRAVAFQFTQYGKSFEARTQAKTVGDMLKEKGVVLGANDGVSVPLSTPIANGMSVAVWRNGKQTVTQEEAIAKPIEEVKDTARDIGFREVKAPGVDGKKQVTYEIEMRDGVEVSRKVIASVVTLQPTKELVTVGAKPAFNGGFAEALARLRSCEAGGVYDRNSGNGYYGAYQYDISTWANYGGYARADLAPPEVQDQKVWETYQRRGWQPWPSCKIKMGLQDIYR